MEHVFARLCGTISEHTYREIASSPSLLAKTVEDYFSSYAFIKPYLNFEIHGSSIIDININVLYVMFG